MNAVTLQREGRNDSGPIHAHARRRKLPVWGIYAVIVAPLIALYHFLPSPLAISAMYALIALSCLIAILVGVHINKPAERLPWYLLATGVGFWLLGDLLWTYFEYVVHSTPFPSVADAIYLSAYAFFAAGIYLLVQRQGAPDDRSLLIDSAIITIGAAVLGWIFLMVPYARDESLGLAEKLVSIAYPVGDVLVLSVLVRVFLGTRIRSIAYVLLTCGLLVTVASDVVYSVMLLNGGYAPGHFVDFGWLFFYALWGLAALHPSMSALTRREPKPPARTSRTRLALMSVVAIAGPSIALVELARGDTGQFFVVTAASLVIFVLVMLRMAGVLARLERAHAKVRRMEREKGRLLDRTMQIGEEERVRLATELHDGPVQQLSAVAYRFEAGLLKLQSGDAGGAEEALTRVRDSLGHEISTLREMMSGLRPGEFDKRELGTALQDLLVAHSDAFGIRTFLDMRLRERLPRQIETGLFRVAQQALMNVGKHANARNVRVELCRDQQGVHFAIEDDGGGFDVESVGEPAEGRFGLIAMRQHVEGLGGSFDVTSSQAGTRILASFASLADGTEPDPFPSPSPEESALKLMHMGH